MSVLAAFLVAIAAPTTPVQALADATALTLMGCGLCLGFPGPLFRYFMGSVARGRREYR